MDEMHYRAAEKQLFDAADIDPRERWLDLPRLSTRARVLEVGRGTPVMFLHGGPMAAATWAYVAARLNGIHAILVDRPGCGLSEPPSEIPDATTLSQYVEQLTEDLLDAASLPRAVLVGSSFGGYSALRSAAALPDRIQGVFLAGCPPFIPGWNQIPYFTMLRAPVLGRLMVRMPASSGTVRMALRQMGQARALRDEAIPSAMLDWERAWQNHTDTLRNDAAMIRRCGSFTGGFDPRVELGSEDLSRVGVPVHVLVGTADPIGGEAVGRRLTDLLPQASLEVWEGAGHLPWLDDPERLARTVQEFTRSAALLKG